MKIRNGFVSNSSSSSFLVDRKRYLSVFDLATAMLDIRNREWKTWNEEEKQPPLDQIPKTQDRRDLDRETKNIGLARSIGINPDTPVSFDVTNGDTYIITHHLVYAVETCNNTDWNEIEGIEGVSDAFNDGLYNKMRKTYYWDLYNDLIYKGDISYDFCKKHSQSLILLKDRTKVCPVCYTGTKHRLLQKKDPKPIFRVREI